MLAALRHRNYSLLWLAGLISLTGDWIMLTALPFYVYARTGSAMATALMWIVEVTPAVLFGSVAGVFVDRWDRRRVMVTADFARALLLLTLLLAGPSTVWLVFVVGFIEQTIGLFFRPARSALLPTLLPDEQLPSANSLMQLSDNVARLVAPSLGGLLLGLVGLRAVALADSCSYLGSALLLGLMTRQAGPAAARVALDAGRAWTAVWREWLDGVRLIRESRVLSVLLGVMCVFVLADNLSTAVLVPFVHGTLHASSQQFGWILTARGAGGVLGTLVVGTVAARFAPQHLLGFGLMALGVTVVGVGVFHALLPTLLLLVVAGLPIVAAIVGETTLLQRLVPDAFRGRVFATLDTSMSAISVPGLALGGALAAVLGPVPVILISGAIYTLAGVLVTALVRVPRAETVRRAEIVPA